MDSEYQETRKLIIIGGSQGVTLNQELLRLLDLSLGDKIKVRYNIITQEIICSGV